MAGQPGDFGTESEHGERVQFAEPGLVHGESVYGSAAGRDALRFAAQQSGGYRSGLWRSLAAVWPAERSDGGQEDRRSERFWRRFAVVQQRSQTSRGAGDQR